MEKLQENLAYYEAGETVEITIERLDDSGAYQSQKLTLELVGKDVMPSE